MCQRIFSSLPNAFRFQSNFLQIKKRLPKKIGKRFFKQYVVVLNFRHHFKIFNFNFSRLNFNTFNGQLTKPLEIEPTGETGIFSVRFYPNGYLPFATIPIKEMENTAISLEKLFENEGLEIEQKILKATSTPERIKLIEIFLLNQLTDTETINRIVKSTVETILAANGQLSVDELSKLTKVNRRQLVRKFSSAIGLSPKQLSKTIRLQATLKMLLNNQFTSLTALAYENEYYDQSHFIKDFKELTGFTPKEFYGTNLKMSSLFYGTD